jgi:hypothetical protein
MLLTNIAAFAQGDENDTGNLEGNDTPAAPINSKLILLLIFGIMLAYYSYKNSKKLIK